MFKEFIDNTRAFITGSTVEASYFNQLQTEYELMTTEEKIAYPTVDQYVFKLLGIKIKKPSWDNVNTLEMALLKMKPITRLRREAWSIRNRYRDVTGEKNFSIYLNSKACDAEMSDENVLRADMEQLLTELHKSYTIKHSCDAIRNNLLKTTLMFMCFFILGMILFGYKILSGTAPDSRLLLFMVIFAGAVGGFVSMQRRLQDDSNENNSHYQYIELSNGKLSIYLAPVSGAIFAVILTTIFAAKLVSNELFPDLQVAAVATEVSKGFFQDVYTGFRPTTALDLFKVLIWAFIAGFAERFVPDTLDRLVTRRSQPPASQAQEMPVTQSVK